MATITANVVSANWNTNGAWAGGVQPTAGDDVVIPSGANITVPAATTVVARSVNNQAGGTLTWASSATAELDVGDASGGAFTNAGTIAVGATLGLLKFVSTQAATKSLTSGGQALPNVTVTAGASTIIQCADALTTTGTTSLTTGKVDTNSQSVMCSSFAVTGSTARTLTMGSSSITASAATNAWSATTITSLTVTANSATVTLTLSSSGTAFSSGVKDWNGMSLVVAPSAGSPTLNAGSCTLANLTLTGVATKTNGFSFGGSVTVTGILTVTGNSVTNRTLVQSNTLATVRTLTVNTTVSVSNADFSDITGAGTASWNLSAATGGSGNAGNNSGITFTTAQPNYWVGDGGSFSDVTHWASSTGGSASSGRVPLPQDTANFDANSFSSGSQNVSLDMPRIGAIDWTGATNAPSFAFDATVSLLGSWTGAAGVTRAAGSGGTPSYAGRSSSNFTINGGGTFPGLTINAPAGTLVMQDGLSLGGTNGLTVTTGTINANGQTFTAGRMSSTGALTRAITMGSGQWTLAATSASAWNTASGGLTLTVTGSTAAFTGTSGSATITTGGVTMPSCTFNGAGGSWSFSDAFTCGQAGTITVTSGSFSTGNQSVTCGVFALSGVTTRSVTLGSSTVTLSKSGSNWTASTTTNLTFAAGTSQITFSVGGSGAAFAGGGLTYNNLTYNNSGGGSQSMSGTNSFSNLTLSVTTATTFTFSQSITVTTTFTASGSSAILRQFLSSSTVGTTRTITAAATSLTNVDFQDVTGAGAAAWTGTSLGDALGNTGITFDAPTTQTRSGAGGNWSTAGNWTSRVPLPQDAVVVDAGSSGTITADMSRLGGSIDFTGFAGTLAGGGNFYGSSLVLSAAMTLTTGSGGWTVWNRTTPTLTFSGKAVANSFTLNAPGGTCTQADAFSTSVGSLVLTAGTWNANDQAVTVPVLSSSGSVATALQMGSGSWSLTSTSGTVWTASASTTVTPSTSTISFVASASSRTFAGGGKTYATFRYDVAASTGAVVLTGANTFASLIVSDARTLTLPSGTVTTVTSTLTLAGTTLNASTIGAAATLATSAGATVTAVTVRDITATPSNTVYALDSSNVANNTGIVFSPPDALPVTRHPRTLLQSVSRAGSW